MSAIKSVAVAGASGNLGSHVVRALLDANFRVTVLTRSKTSEAYDSNVKVKQVDYTSVESVATALEGVDGFVSTLGGAAIDSQTVLVDAAVAAGVKRFIPSEFGSVTTNPKLEATPPYSAMFKIRQYLQSKSKTSKLTWTVLRCGAFMEFLFHGPVYVDYENHKAELYDEGDNRVSSTTLPKIGTALAGIFKNPDATENKIVKVSEAILTQNMLLKFAKEIKPDVKWTTTKVQASAVFQNGLDIIKSGDIGGAMMEIVKGSAFAGELYGAAFDGTDNELLGVKEMTDEDLKKLVAKALK